MSNRKIYKILNPIGIKMIISMVMIIIILVESLVRNRELTYYFYFGIVWSIFCTVILLISISRTYTKSKVIEFDTKRILVNGEVIRAEEIEQIMIYKEVVGVKPKGKRIVPLNLCFRFNRNQSGGIVELETWAEENTVKFSRRFFMKWL
ncbi:hypothetical protein [Paenibacillus pini]|uniref:DUF304 domain-containing protein n=1 Tax=Paenibacillus pini JCM 16418 TaxID=1236976 RepID=W7YGC7_9BACL|nr:hypothetical protein [Paenibacillus pini]GAF06578.1 hypothetical protein JCM16418_543 [Paenibacillus pini JCM 16418]